MKEIKPKENFLPDTIYKYIQNMIENQELILVKQKEDTYLYKKESDSYLLSIKIIDSSITSKIVINKIIHNNNEKNIREVKENITVFWNSKEKKYTYCYKILEYKYYKQDNNGNWINEKGHFTHYQTHSTSILENGNMVVHYTYQDFDNGTPLDQWILAKYQDPINISTYDISFKNYFEPLLDLQIEHYEKEKKVLSIIEEKRKIKYISNSPYQYYLK